MIFTIEGMKCLHVAWIADQVAKIAITYGFKKKLQISFQIILLYLITAIFTDFFPIPNLHCIFRPPREDSISNSKGSKDKKSSFDKPQAQVIDFTRKDVTLYPNNTHPGKLVI